jgi:hypothetical protein
MKNFIEVTSRSGILRLVNINHITAVYTDQDGDVCLYSTDTFVHVNESYSQIKTLIEEAQQ